jgi:hypothetical protein
MFEKQIKEIAKRLSDWSKKYSQAELEFVYWDGHKTESAPADATNDAFTIEKLVTIQKKGKPLDIQDIEKSVAALVAEYGIMYGWYRCRMVYFQMTKPKWYPVQGYVTLNKYERVFQHI